MPLRHLQQPIQPGPLLVIQQPVQRLPQPLGCCLPTRAHQPGQHRHSRQQHLPFPHPRHRRVEQRLRAIASRPCPRLDPLAQLSRDLGEIPPCLGLLDLPGMGPGRPVPLPVLLQTRRVRDLQLLGQVLGHLHRNLPGIDEMLTAPVVDRLIADPEIVRDLRDRSARLDEIKHLTAELRRIAAGQRASQRASGSLIIQ